mgnify:FL=1
MNNLTSLLSFVDFGSALVNVLAIIAIIIAGGFIIFFLGDLLLSILDPKTEDKKKAKEERPEVLKEEKKVEEPKFVPIEEVKPEPVQEKEEEVKTVDEDLAEKERLELGYVEEPKDSFADLRAAEEEYKQNNLKALEEKQNIVKEEPADEDIDLNDFFFDDEDFNFGVQEDEEPEKVEEDKLDGQVSIFNEEAPVSEEKVEEKTETVEENKVSEEAQAEIDELRRELEEQKAEYEALKEQTEKEKNKWQEERAALENLFETTENKEEFVPMMTLKEYEARLEVLKERLKANEKDLKANKKEFLPLARVKKNLDNDKKKLRRREALVAKQKVVLYGVNNYVDIDEEKAKKLAEDLDLLDGLRLSVQHCEEVIAANKERYPILETTNRILTTVNKEIKADIQEVETAIAKLKAEEDAGSKEEVKEEQPAVQETPAAQEETVAETPVEQAETVEEKKETTENNTEN